MAGEGTLRCVALEPDYVEVSEPAAIDVLQDAVVDLRISPPCRLELRSSEWWHAPTIVQKDQGEVSLALWPSAVLTGTIVAPDPPPAELQLRFTPPADDEVVSRLSGTTVCPIVDAQFRCVVPAGRYHLRLRSQQFIPVHRWDVVASADQPGDLGKIALRDGASIEGWLSNTRSNPIGDWREALVSAAPVGLRGPDAQGSSMSAKATEHGSFQLAGLPPGEYIVSAALADLVSEEVRVRVLPDAQVELTTSLTLQKPKTLDVKVTPPLDPSGSPWTVRLTRYFDRRGEIVTESQADQSGRWSVRRLREAEYEVDVAPSGQYSWHNVRVAIGDADVHVPVTISTIRVRGSLAVSDRPVAGATVHLGGRNGRTRQVTTTDSDGQFDTVAPGLLASDRRWTVEVEAEHPAIHQRLNVIADIDHGDHVLAIVLPDLRISGRVLRNDGSAARDAMVNITERNTNGMFRQIAIDEGGDFVVTGLTAGEYQLQALGAMQESETVDVSLRNDEPVPSVDLILQANGQLVGRLTSAYGPVPGVKLWVRPTDVRYSFIIPVTTRPDGTFTARLAPGTRQADVLITAPGFGLGLFHTHIENRPLNINLDDRSGTLHLFLPPLSHPLFSRAELRHRGATTAVSPLLVNWGTRIISEDANGAELIVPLADTGEWQLCLSPDEGRAARCHSGYLAPGGELTLRVAVASITEVPSLPVRP